MKKILSLVLAFMLALGCTVSLGGCGKAAECKEAFIASRGYYSGLIDNLAAPVADIDTAALAEAQASGMTGKVSFSVEGLERLSKMLAQFMPEGTPAPSDFAADFDFVTDGLAASGNLALTLLGETLKAAFSSDGTDVALSIPDLLSRPLLLDADGMAGYGYGDPDFEDADFDLDGELDFDLDDGEEDYDSDDYEDDGLGLLDLDDADYDAEYDFDENGKYYAENGDLYVDTDGDGKLDLVFGAGTYDDEFVDGLIGGALEPGDYYGGFPLDFNLFNAEYMKLASRFGDLFLESLPESCYSSGRENFRTADGDKELECLTLSADGAQLGAAYKAALEALAEDAVVEETYGDDAEEVRGLIHDAAAQCDEPEFLAEAAKCALSWTRFTKDGKTVGDKAYAALPDAEYSLEAGLDEGSDSTLAFFKLTDEKEDTDLIDAESAVGKKKAKLDLRFTANGTTYAFGVSGKTTEKGGAKVTEADIKIGVGELSFNLFNLKTTVRAFDAEAVDFDFELSSDIMSLLSGGSGFSVKLAVDARVDASASPEAIDVTGAYTRADADTEAFKNELYGNLEAKFPNLCALIQSLAAGADEAED